MTAMLAALAGEDVLAADETPVNVLDRMPPAPQPGAGGRGADPEEKTRPRPGAPHVLITRTPDGRLTFLQAIASRRKAAIAAGLPGAFTGYLITDGYTGYQHLLVPARRASSSAPAHYPDTAVMPILAGRCWRAGVTGCWVSA